MPNPVTSGSVVALFGLAALMALVAISPPNELLYDERFHLPTVERLREQGFSLEYFRSPSDMAPGPLYTLTHTLALPLTHLRPISVRFLTVALFMTLIATLYVQLHSQGTPFALAVAPSIIAVPALWPVAGLALTEIPATLALCLYACLATRLFVRPTQYRAGHLLIAGVVAVMFGAAVCGRQNVLCALPAVVLLARSRSQVPSLLAIVVLAPILPVMLFCAWGGLTPPGQSKFTESLLSVGPAFLGLAYAGISALILDPTWLLRRVRLLPLGLLLGIALSIFVPCTDLIPIRSVAQDVLSLSCIAAISFGSGFLLYVLGACYLLWLVVALFEAWGDPVRRFQITTLLLLLASIAPIGQFSSRYVVTAIPFVLLVHADKGLASVARPFLMAGGVLLGILSLLSYYSLQ